jgi:hypothetical protein
LDVIMAQNFRVLQPSRKRLAPGDVFAMGLPDDTYLFGRVISTAARWSLAEGSGTTNLVYVFSHRSESKATPDRAHLRIDQLFIPPQLINRLGWSRGYFETVGRLELTDDEVLPVHCFKRSFGASPRWFDEHGNELDEPVPPVGVWGGGNYRTLENEVCRALGIPLAPDE